MEITFGVFVAFISSALIVVPKIELTSKQAKKALLKDNIFDLLQKLKEVILNSDLIAYRWNGRHKRSQ